MSIHDFIAFVGEIVAAIAGVAVCLGLSVAIYGIRKGFTLRWSPPPQKDAPACDHVRDGAS